jgi:hypothetical protein
VVSQEGELRYSAYCKSLIPFPYNREKRGDSFTKTNWRIREMKCEIGGGIIKSKEKSAS